MWRGFYTSLRPGPNKIFVNIDIASQPMYQSGNLANVALDFLRAATRGISLNDLAASNIPPRGYIELDRFFRTVKVQPKVRDRDGNEPVRKIKQFERSSAFASSFRLEDGTTHTVEVRFNCCKVRERRLKEPTSQSYFKLQYSVTLKRPDFVRWLSLATTLARAVVDPSSARKPCVRVSKVALWPLVSSRAHGQAHYITKR